MHIIPDPAAGMMLFAVLFNFARLEQFGWKSLSVLSLSHAGLFENSQPKLPSCSQDPCLQDLLVLLEVGVQS